MTTIAFRNGTLAADSLTTDCGVPLGHSVKVGRYPADPKVPAQYLYTAVGDTSMCQAFRAWAASENKRATQPPCLKKGDVEATGLIYTAARDGGGYDVTLYEGASPPYTLEVPYYAPGGCYVHAQGSGAAYAYGAAMSGQDPAAAVETAIWMDRYSGGYVSSVTLGAATPTTYERKGACPSAS